MPEVPKSSRESATRRSNTSPELQSGQYVATTARPPTVSLTISCHIKIWSGLGARVSVQVHGEDRLLLSEPQPCRIRGDEDWTVDRGDPVGRRAAGDDLVEWNHCPREVRPERLTRARGHVEDRQNDEGCGDAASTIHDRRLKGESGWRARRAAGRHTRGAPRSRASRRGRTPRARRSRTLCGTPSART